MSTLTDWELVVVDDGSPDDVAGALGPSRPHPRMQLLRLPMNRGLGAALERRAGRRAGAYLPCDDLYDPGHLAALRAELADLGRVLVWSGVRHHDGATALDGPPGDGLQLVQVMPRRTRTAG